MRAVESLKICFLMGSFCPKHNNVLDEKVPKSYVSWHWSVMQSLKKSWLFGSKNDMRNLVNFKESSGISEKLHFDVLLLSITYYAWAKIRGIMCHITEEWCKIWKGTNLYSEKWHEEFGKFWRNTRKSQNLHFNGFLLTKVYNVWANKVQRSYASLYWRSVQNLKEK